VGIEPNPGPGRRGPLSDEKKWQIVFSVGKGKPNYSRVARKVGCNDKTVKNVLKKYEETGSVANQPKSGRKRKLSDADVKQMVKKAKKGKFAPQIARESKKKVSARTVRRELKKGGVCYLKKKKIEKLSEAHKRKRVTYAEEMKDYKWNTVLFSDEKTFYLGASLPYAWQVPNNRITEEETPYAPKLNVWGAMGTHVKTKLYYFNENMDFKLYQKVLKSCLKEKNLIYSPKCPARMRGNWVFLQDNASYHTKAESMETLEKLVGDRWIKHPAKSPDLNPMENIWSYLDRKAKEAQPKTIQSLKRILTQVWNLLSWNEIATYTRSMKGRLEKCIEQGGQRLNY